MDTQPPPEQSSGPTPDETTTPGSAVQADGTGSGKGPGRSPAVVAVVIAVALAMAVVLVNMASSEPEDESASPSVSPTSVSSPSVSSTGTPSETVATPVARPAPPTGMGAEPAAFEVLVTWEPAVDEGAAPASYEIWRDGELIATVDADRSSFLDEEVLPATSYEYEIIAVGADGLGSAETASVTTETKSARLADARVSGTFDIAMRDTSHFGYATLGDPPTSQRWKTVPTCPEGACAVKLSVDDVKGSSTRLAMDSGAYAGSYVTEAFVRCDGVPSTTTVTIRFEVTRAAVVGGEWRATKIAGDMTHREEPQSSCVASGIDFTVAGTLAQG